MELHWSFANCHTSRHNYPYEKEFCLIWIDFEEMEKQPWHRSDLLSNLANSICCNDIGTSNVEGKLPRSRRSAHAIGILRVVSYTDLDYTTQKRAKETHELLRKRQSQSTKLSKSASRSTVSVLTEASTIALTKEKSKTTQNLILLGFLLALPILIGIYIQGLANFNGKIASTVIYQFFISGFGEEILFRGYVQSRINQEFGRPYKFLGVNFGIGLFIASFMFGFLHILNTFSPFTGSFTVLPWWGVSAFFSGLFFGFVREKTGSIIAVGIAHGLPDAVGEAFGMIFPFL